MVVFKIIALDLLVVRHCRVNCSIMSLLSKSEIPSSYPVSVAVQPVCDGPVENMAVRAKSIITHS